MDTVKKVLDNRKNQVEQGEEQFLYTLTGMYSFSLFFGDILTSSSLGISLLSSVGTGLAFSFLPSFPPSLPRSCLFCFLPSLSFFLSNHIVLDLAFSLYTVLGEVESGQAEKYKRKEKKTSNMILLLYL